MAPAFHADGEALIRVRRLPDAKDDVVGENARLTRIDLVDPDGERLVQELRLEQRGGPIEKRPQAARAKQVQRRRPRHGETIAVREEQGRELADVVEVEVADELVGERLPGQSEARHRVQRAGTSVETDPEPASIQPVARAAADRGEPAGARAQDREAHRRRPKSPTFSRRVTCWDGCSPPTAPSFRSCYG